jgi:dephospho-CoA kinase
VLIIGLTGSVGMGKSTIAARFREHGVPVCDADAEVHSLYAGPAVAPVEAAFPGTTSRGIVDRRALAAALLKDPEAFTRLEAIVHPLVQEREREFLRNASAQQAAMAVLEIPLLFEIGEDRRVDTTVVASAPAEIQRERVLSRLGMNPEKLAAMLARQLPDAEKRRRADFVVDTGGTVTSTIDQVDKIIGLLRGREGSAYHRYWA